jgi:hypothetical protein
MEMDFNARVSEEGRNINGPFEVIFWILKWNTMLEE